MRVPAKVLGLGRLNQADAFGSPPDSESITNNGLVGTGSQGFIYHRLRKCYAKNPYNVHFYTFRGACPSCLLQLLDLASDVMNDRTLNTSMRWSNLAKFGSSKFGQMTLVVPALGYLIFFNSFVEQYLRPLQISSGDGFFHRLSEARLELLYIGLVLVGTSVALFSVFAPQQIKDHNLFSSFMRNKLELQTDESVKFSLAKLLYLYSNQRQLKWFRRYLLGVHLPKDYQNGFEKAIVSIWANGILQKDDLSEQNDEAFLIRLRTYSLSDEDIAVLNLGSPKFARDIFRNEYIFVEFFSFPIRLFVFGLFCIGVFVCISPTLVTLALVLEKLQSKIG